MKPSSITGKYIHCSHVCHCSRGFLTRVFSCAQVKVVGGGNGNPGPTVKFPGAYKKDDPSFNFSIYGGYKEYPMPGPEVWSGASGSKSFSKVVNVNAADATSEGTFGHREHARDFSY